MSHLLVLPGWHVVNATAPGIGSQRSHSNNQYLVVHGSREMPGRRELHYQCRESRSSARKLLKDNVLRSQKTSTLPP